MTELIALVSSGKDTWAQVSKVIEKGEWSKVLLVTNRFGSEKFHKPDNGEFIVLDQNKSLTDITSHLRALFKEKISSMEVAVSIISGDGKEHTAVLSALMSAGVGFRLVAVTKEGLKEF